MWIFLLLSGEIEYRVEGSIYPMQAGDLVLMKKGEVHIPTILSATPYERMHVNFDIQEILPAIGRDFSLFSSRPLGKLNYFPAALFRDNRWKEYIDKICMAKDDATRLCYLLPLLQDLEEKKEQARQAPTTRCDPAAPILQFVNDNLVDEMNLDVICNRFFVSKAHLNRIFRRSTGTTAWAYITMKRLLLAREKIEKGEPPTRVYTQCGYHDYATFFRAYKKQFGVAPNIKDSHF